MLYFFGIGEKNVTLGVGNRGAMFCNFCGKNFDATEGFEEIARAGHYYVRCEKCVFSNREDEYNWRREMYGRGKNRGHRSGPSRR